MGQDRFAGGQRLLSAETHWGNHDSRSAESYGRFLSNRFRYYDPQIGRYVSADPIGQLGGSNVYRYASNDPTNSSDPLGLNNFGGPIFQSSNRNAPLYRQGPTDAEARAIARNASNAIAFTLGGTALGAAISGFSFSPPVKAGLFGAGLTATILAGYAASDPDADNDNDGLPDGIDPDDDNDDIPDFIDPDPLISCDFGGGVCATPAQNSCGGGSAL